MGGREAMFARLKSGLTKSSKALSDGLSGLLGGRSPDAAMLAELEEMLIAADLGVEAAAALVAVLKNHKMENNADAAEIKSVLAGEIAQRLAPLAKVLDTEAAKPFVILMAGVNGAGKTTTIGKMAQQFLAAGKKVMLVAGDTFRAAAVEQLSIWGDRAGVPVVTTKSGGDAAGLVFDALTRARAEDIDVVLIDTAGRLQSNDNLMAELEKIIRVMQKIDASAPHASLLVLDATTGQNAISQAQIFQASAKINGLVMTKLDGTARGGVLVAVAEKLALPIYFIGTGEAAEDLHRFNADDYARALVGLEEGAKK